MVWEQVTIPAIYCYCKQKLIADHYHLAASLAHIDFIDSPKCKCNLEDETLNHVLWQCNLYNVQRTKLISNLRKINLHLPLDVASLIASPNIKACHYILAFLNNCNLRI